MLELWQSAEQCHWDPTFSMGAYMCIYIIMTLYMYREGIHRVPISPLVCVETKKPQPHPPMNTERGHRTSQTGSVFTLPSSEG